MSYFVIRNNFAHLSLIVPLTLVLLLALSLMIRIHPPSVHSRRTKENPLPFVTPSSPSLQIPCASSADAPVTASLRALRRLRRKEHKILRSTQTEISANAPIILNSVSDSISTILDDHANGTTQTNTYVHSVDDPSTVLSPVPVSNLVDEDSFLVHVSDLESPDPPAPRFIYRDNLQKHPSPHDLDADYSLVNTPYSPEGFDHLLEITNLTVQFPELTWKLRNGFPIGDMSPLTSTYTPHNLPGADIHREVCDEYVADELSKGRFSGPYTHEQLFAKIGHFRSSPLQVVVKKGINGAPDKHRVCRHLSYRGSMSASINDEIDASNYPTEWGTAA